MPFTPFLGLSILVHLVVILSHRLFSHVPWAKAGPRKESQLTRAVGLAIVVVIFLGILINAGLLLRASIKSQYSSINLIGHYIDYRAVAESIENKQIIFSYHPAPTPLATLAAQVKQEFLKGISQPCVDELAGVKSAYKGSLSNYLWLNNTDASFRSREKLAQKFNIIPYSGTSNQNRVLWLRLLENEGSLAGITLTPCVN